MDTAPIKTRPRGMDAVIAHFHADSKDSANFDSRKGAEAASIAKVSARVRTKIHKSPITFSLADRTRIPHFKLRNPRSLAQGGFRKSPYQNAP